MTSSINDSPTSNESSSLSEMASTNTALTPNEKRSMAWTSGFTGGSLILALVSANFGLLLLHTIAIGALGGLVHEFAQSSGRIFFIRKEKDGLYLGSLSGMVLGIVAGLLVIAENDAQPQPQLGSDQTKIETIQSSQSIDLSLSLEIFFAALGLKGVTEAATGNIPSEKEGD